MLRGWDVLVGLAVVFLLEGEGDNLPGKMARETCRQSCVTAGMNTSKANAPGHTFVKDSFQKLI